MKIDKNIEIRKGVGDNICCIVNELVNRELVRRKFKFEEKIIKEEGEEGIGEENG